MGRDIVELLEGERVKISAGLESFEGSMVRSGDGVVEGEEDGELEDEEGEVMERWVLLEKRKMEMGLASLARRRMRRMGRGMFCCGCVREGDFQALDDERNRQN
jgi:hypothetical protein